MGVLILTLMSSNNLDITFACILLLSFIIIIMTVVHHYIVCYILYYSDSYNSHMIVNAGTTWFPLVLTYGDILASPI